MYFGHVPRRLLRHLLGEQQAFDESRFFIGHVLILLGSPARESNIVSDFGILMCCWLVTLTPRKHVVSCFWRSTTAVWRTRRPRAPIRNASQFRCPRFPVRSCSCPQVICRRLAQGCCFFSLCAPTFRQFFYHYISRGGYLCCDSTEANLKRNTSACDDGLFSHTSRPVSGIHVPAGRAKRKVSE